MPTQEGVLFEAMGKDRACFVHTTCFYAAKKKRQERWLMEFTLAHATN